MLLLPSSPLKFQQYPAGIAAAQRSRLRTNRGFSPQELGKGCSKAQRAVRAVPSQLTHLFPGPPCWKAPTFPPEGGNRDVGEW